MENKTPVPDPHSAIVASTAAPRSWGPFGPPAGSQVGSTRAKLVKVEAAFIPEFRTVYGMTPGYVPWELNRWYFATLLTAQWIANKYGDGGVFEVPFGGVGGIFTATGLEYHIHLKDGRDVNAGILASYYERNPEKDFPGLADKLIKSVLGVA